MNDTETIVERLLRETTQKIDQDKRLQFKVVTWFPMAQRFMDLVDTTFMVLNFKVEEFGYLVRADFYDFACTNELYNLELYNAFLEQEDWKQIGIEAEVSQAEDALSGDY